MTDQVEPIDHPDDPDAAPPPSLPQRDDDPKNGAIPDVPETDPESETAGGTEPNA